MTAINNNAILSALPGSDLAALKPRLRPIELNSGVLVGEIGAPIIDVIFPTTGLISVVAELASGERIETAVIGRAGVFGGAVAFGATTHVSTSLVQMPGTALSIRARELVEIARQSAELSAILFRHEQFLLVQAQQSTACNARHQVSERLATWLLRVCDSTGVDRLQLTQEFLAEMLGVQRATVSLMAGKLQEAGLISYRRGHIEIVDHNKLGQAACECHHAVGQHRKRLFDRAAKS